MSRGLLFRMVAIVVVSLVFPLAFTAYGLYSGARVERLAVEERERQMQRALGEVSAGLREIAPDRQTVDALDREVRGVLNRILAGYPGIRAGVFLPETRRTVIGGELKWYDYRPEIWPKEGQELFRERDAVIHEALKTGEAITRRITMYRGEGLVHALPVTVGGEKAVAWAEEVLQPAFGRDLVVRKWAFLLTTMGFLVALASALYISGSLGRGVNRIKNGLERLKRDLSYRLPSMPGELGQIAAAINQLAQGLWEKERLEEQLQRSARLAALGHLTAGVAHEMRNPLGIIRGTAQIMAQEYSHVPGLAEDVAVIMEQADRQNRVIRELLDFARPAPPLMQEINLNAILESVLSFSRKFLEQNQVNLVTQLSPDLPQVQADGEKIKQVFLNLLLNAVEAMPTGGTITIETSATQDGVAVSFGDTGPGISPEARLHLFDPFYTTKSDGTGLGLAICHQIVTMHGGSIEVETGDRGSVFRVSLPRSPERRDAGGTLDPGD